MPWVGGACKLFFWFWINQIRWSIETSLGHLSQSFDFFPYLGVIRFFQNTPVEKTITNNLLDYM